MTTNNERDNSLRKTSDRLQEIIDLTLRINRLEKEVDYWKSLAITGVHRA